MRADFEQLHEDIVYPLNAAFNEDEDQEAEPRRRPPSRSRPRDESRVDSNEPRSNYYYVDRERREYRYASPRPRRMIQSTKPNYTRWLQPAEIEEENMPEGEDPDNPNYTPSEAEELKTGRAWYVENHHQNPSQLDPVALWTGSASEASTEALTP